jgi:hypothetical protein
VFVAQLDGGSSVWATQFGGMGSASVRTTGAAVDGDGSVLVVGTFGGTIDFGGVQLTSAGVKDLFVAKLDPMGNCTWVKDFDEPPGKCGPTVAADHQGNVFVGGCAFGSVDFGGGPLTIPAGTEDAFVTKLTQDGDYLWARLFDTSPVVAPTSITTDGVGDVLVTASYQGTVDFGCGPLTGGGPQGAFVAELDSDGATMWAKQFVGGSAASGPAAGWGAAVDAMGDAYVAGDFSGSIDFGAGPVMGGNDNVFVTKLSP